MDLLKDKVSELLELTAKYQPQQVKTPDTKRSIRLIQEISEIDSALEGIQKETEKHKRKLEKELAAHKRMMDKLFSSILSPSEQTNTPTQSHGYKTWMIKWWSIWREQRREGQSWDADTLRQTAKCYSVPTWDKKQELLIEAGILTLETDGSLTVNVMPQSLTSEVSK